jgi:biopolymer transport protein ExbB
VTLFGESDCSVNILGQQPPAEKFYKKYLEIAKTFNFGAFKALLKPLTMKKLFAIFALVGVLASSTLLAQDTTTQTTDTATTEAGTPATESAPASTDIGDATEEGGQSFHEILKDLFIAGDVRYMTPILICIIIGLAIAIERIITLNLATTNTKKLLGEIEDALSRGGVNAALEITRNTRGPVASIFTQGLMRYPEGIDMVEKSIVSYGGVEMGRLERGLIWISLMISLGPMLGFFGTVVGMVIAFETIEKAGDISPNIVAGGMKVALLTTVGGLVVGMILQVLYNYLVAKIDSLVNTMEDASIALVDILVKHKLVTHK